MTRDARVLALARISECGLYRAFYPKETCKDFCNTPNMQDFLYQKAKLGSHTALTVVLCF
jgi:hypothetical protein